MIVNSIDMAQNPLSNRDFDAIAKFMTLLMFLFPCAWLERKSSKRLMQNAEDLDTMGNYSQI